MVVDNDYDLKFWPSHMPILLEFIEVFKPISYIEFGCGYSSTPLFDQISMGYSYETSNSDWATNVNILCHDHRVKFIPYNEILDDVKFRSFDLCFVDGNDRPLELIIGLSHSRCVIIHDSQPKSKIFDLVDIQEDWYRIDFTKFPMFYSHDRSMNPWTSLLTKNIDIFNYFNTPGLEESLYVKYKYPYSDYLW